MKTNQTTRIDAVTLLEQDHEEVERRFVQFEGLGGYAGVPEDLLGDVIRLLSIHAAIEEQVLYPVLRDEVPGGEALVEEALREHQQVKELLADMEKTAAGDAAVRAKFEQLVRDVRQHVEEERAEAFPRLRETLGQDRLTEIGDALAAAKKVAPTRPHPHAPNTPPGNVVAGLGAAAVDRVRDAVSGEGGRT